MILCNLLWSAHPLMGKLALRAFSPEGAALARYGAAFATYLVLVAVVRAPTSSRARAPFLLWPSGARARAAVVAMGLLTFFASPLLQLWGLSSSQASENALVIAMEPLITVALAWIVLREPLRAAHGAGFALAIGGFLLLSGWRSDGFGFSVGNLLLVASMVGEGAYSTLGRFLVRVHRPLTVFGTALGLGCAGLVAVFTLVGTEFVRPDASGVDLWRAAGAIFWLGPLGTTLAYAYWMNALRKASVASLALTLFIQPFLGTLLGVLVLGEALAWMQLAGGGLILVAMGIQVLDELRQQKRVKRVSGLPV